MRNETPSSYYQLKDNKPLKDIKRPKDCLYWDTSCDISLLKDVICYGLNQPELYYQNDLVIRIILRMSFGEDPLMHNKFLEARVNIFYKKYK